MSKAVRLINDYLEAIRKTQEVGEKLGELICETVRDILPDIEFGVGWSEWGLEYLCLYSRSHDYRILSSPQTSIKDFIHLSRVIEEIFPQLVPHIITPSDIYLTPEEAEAVRKRLKALREA